MNRLDTLTPAEIVAYLDKYIIGQEAAKRALAIALRNRIRRRAINDPIAEEIMPKNILMIGPTGVGKTELVRRIAQLVDMPFIKVEATKFTEVGYVGRDVESMVRDLVNLTVERLKARKMKEIEGKTQHLAQERILNILLPPTKNVDQSDEASYQESREKLRNLLVEGKLDQRTIEIEVSEPIFSVFEVFSPGLETIDINLPDVLSNLLPPRMRKRKVTIAEARAILAYEESQKLIDMDKLTKEAIRKVEEEGVIFIDEIDKIISKGSGSGPDVSREGVQRDLLPIVEGSMVNTRYGPVRTNHILFISAGTFHNSKPSELIPELQGRFPIRVELSSLTKEDFKRILTEPENALIKQYKALLLTEGVEVEFSEDGIDKIGQIVAYVNEHTDDIGARRLHTILEKIMEDISFNAPTLTEKYVKIDANYVEKQLSKFIKQEDLTHYVL